jgi:hypothetical protein
MEKEIGSIEPIRSVLKNHDFKEPEINAEGQQEDSDGKFAFTHRVRTTIFDIQ